MPTLTVSQGLISSVLQETGSILLASDATESEQLQERAIKLQHEGLMPAVLSSQDLREAEPALRVSDDMSGLLLKTDAQIVSNVPFSDPSYNCLHRLGPRLSLSALQERGSVFAKSKRMRNLQR